MYCHTRGPLGSFIIFLVFIFSSVSHGEMVQILHTNDLHGFLEHSVSDQKKGGFHNVKRVFEEQKLWAKSQDIPTLTLDAGDFAEGSLFYFAQNGRRSFEVMNLMGYDAVVMGNHDWLMGSKELNKIMKEVEPNFTYLGANIKVNSVLHPALHKKIEPYKIVTIGDIKIAILGLTTSEKFYSWRFENGKIKKPVKVAKKYAKKLKKKLGVDYVIVLSHTGVWKDEEIIKGNDRIDLIVGGHSHTAIHKPYYVKDKKGVARPIVQAGEHGKFVGQLLLKLNKGKKLEIVQYRLIPVENKGLDHSHHPQVANAQEDVQNYVKKTREIIEDRFSKDWLYEVMGESLIPLMSSDSQLTTWTALVTDGLKECVNADLSVHSPGFGGADLPTGKITRELVFQGYPRIFDMDSQYGWRLYDVEIYGFFIKTIVKLILNRRLPVAFSGITFDIHDENDEVVQVQTSGDINDEIEHKSRVIQHKFLGLLSNYRISNIRINGQKVKWTKKYHLALPEGIVRGGLGITRFVKFVFRSISKNEYSVWECLNKKVQKEQLLTFDYQNNKWDPVVEKSLKSGNHEKAQSFGNRMFIIPRVKPLEKVYTIPQ